MLSISFEMDYFCLLWGDTSGGLSSNLPHNLPPPQIKWLAQGLLPF